MLVFYLPFCLLLPDGDYHIRLDRREVVKLNLTKVISKIFDERLPFRGFLKGELENITKLKLWDHKTGESKWVEANHLEDIHEMRYVIEYFTKDGKRVFPEATPSAIEDDVDLFDDVKHDFLKTHDVEESDQIASNLILEGRNLVINGEIARDRHGRFRYSRVRYWPGNPAPNEEEFKKALKSINLLISKYRIYTHSYWITNVTEQEFFVYKSMSDAASGSFVSKGISHMASDCNEDVVKTML